jgi:O-antigen ligase
VTRALAVDAAHPIEENPTKADRFEHVGLLALYGVAGALQFSIAAAQILLTLALLCWFVVLVIRRERVEAPSFFWPLVAYGAWTLVSAGLSANPRASLADSKQLVLFLIVPAVYRLVRGTRGSLLMTIAVTCAAGSAAFGIFEYTVLHFDHLGQRPTGMLGHWMTYSGLLMLVVAIAMARVLFGRNERTWSAIVIPALVVAVAVTFTRSAMIGICAAAAVLFSLKDLRLFAVLPVVAALFVVLAPAKLTQRFVSTFDLKDPTNQDRLVMMRVGRSMIASHPLTGVGPAMVQPLYADYRGPDPTGKVNPHLHNIPLQIAAERGLPALAIWLWFIVVVVHDTWRRFKSHTPRFLAAASLACVTALLTAGLFEYNFGDSEVLMLFLIVITLPFAADRAAAA